MAVGLSLALAGCDVDAADYDVFEWAILCASWGRTDRIDNVAGSLVGNFTEDRVAAVQVRGWAEGDEELRAVSARASVRHGQQVRLVELQLWVKLVFELVSRAADADAERVAALDHEAADNAVEDHIVVERTFAFGSGLRVGPFAGAICEAGEVRHRLGGVIAEQVDLDIALVGVEGRHCSLISHLASLRWPGCGSLHAGGSYAGRVGGSRLVVILAKLTRPRAVGRPGLSSAYTGNVSSGTSFIRNWCSPANR